MSSRLLALIVLASLAPIPAAAEPSYLPGTDILGSDYRNFNLLQDRPRLCQESCLGDARCRAWTFVRPDFYGPLASCWLKFEASEPRSNPCCVSGTR